MPRIDALEPSSSSQRNSLSHQAIEDYLKTIYQLAELETPVSTSRIAEARDLKPGSVTNMIQRLSKLQLVEYKKHNGVTLTPSGEKIALEVIRHHRLIELYLMETLGFGWDEVHEQADVLEHVISEKLEQRMAEVLGHPKFDPHGQPIPSKDGVIVQRDTYPMIGLTVGQTAVVARVLDDENSDMLRYLGNLGLRPGVMFTVTAVAPFDGPLTIQIDGVEKVVGYTVAAAIHVTDITN